ncbi:MAG: J domain-containing protein [Hyphomicrobiales bacterium]
MTQKVDYFDRIRVSKKRKEERPAHVACEWPGCTAAGAYRAPKKKRSEGEYHSFCLDHVKEYNKSYNYFEGMDDDAIAGYQKAAQTGHRPTWKLGQNSWAEYNGGKLRGSAFRKRARDPFNILGEDGEAPAAPRPRTVKTLERKALDALGLDETATSDQIKAQYKLLVKKFHPDANGGSRAMEDRFREIIQAYDLLRASGYC